MFPDKSVIKALFETYFNIRKATWGLVSADENIRLPEIDSTQMKKIDTCLNLLKELSEVSEKKVEDWVKLINAFDNVIASEPSTFANMLYITEPYLIKMLMAVNSYIVTSLANQPKFRERMIELTNEIAITKNAIKHKCGDTTLAGQALDKKERELALYTSSDTHISYFNTTIKHHDPAATILKETAFEDYVKNVKEGLRNTTLTTKIKAAIAARTAEIEKSTTLSTTEAVPEKKKISQKISDLRKNSTFKIKEEEEKAEDKPKNLKRDESKKTGRYRRTGHG